MKTIAFFTTTRAEFGLFLPLIKAISSESELKALLFVGGSHLAPEYGLTVNEIKNSNVLIADTFDYLLNENSNTSLIRSSGIALFKLAEIFNRYLFDFVCVLGDRFELLTIVQCAVIHAKPIIHIHGGESSEGVIDEQIRHMITKAAHLHFVTTEEYANNVRKMGEQSFRIFNTGALCVDGIVNREKVGKEQIFRMLNLDATMKTIVLTYHPVTMETEIPPQEQIQNIFNAIRPYDFQAIITSPNADPGRENINDVLLENIQKSNRYHYIHSLGTSNYYNLIPHCEFIAGNSSSGIIEVPFFRIPSINIGERQKGRIRHESVIDADYSVESISKAVTTALSPGFRKKINIMKYKFGNGLTAARMIKIIKETDINQALLKKSLDFPHEI